MKQCRHCNESNQDLLFQQNRKTGLTIYNVCKKCRSENQSKNRKGKNLSEWHKKSLSIARRKTKSSWAKGKTKENCDSIVKAEEKRKQLRLAGKFKANSPSTLFKKTGFRSSWEKIFADKCKKLGLKYLYEPKTFDLGTTTYTPDFYLASRDLYIEIKADFWSNNLYKVDAFRKLGHNIKVLNLEKIQVFT